MIYFIVASEIDRVKIGFAKNPRLRLNKLKSDSPCDVKLHAFIEGEVADEQALHRRFAAYRLRGEWFSFAGELRAYVQSLDPAPPQAARKQAKGTAELARKAGMSQSYVSQILSGKRNGLAAIIHLCRTTDWRPEQWADMSEETIRKLAENLPYRRAA